MADLETQIATLSKNVVMAAALLLVVLVAASVVLRDRVPKLKPLLFGGLALTLLAPTLLLIGSTLYLNHKADSGGPVHWHAEIEFWACGTELELRDPVGRLNNKIGTNTYHEHNDKHIHLEGVVVLRKEDSSLGKFMRVVGGTIDNQQVAVPLNERSDQWLSSQEHTDGDRQGLVSLAQLESQFVKQSTDGPVAQLKNGQQCEGAPSKVQVFVYSYDESTNSYSQSKLEDPAGYTIRDESSLGPPSDCIIVEFGPEKGRTDKLCQQYGLRDKKRCVEFGVKQYSDDLCYATEIISGGTE